MKKKFVFHSALREEQSLSLKGLSTHLESL